MMLSKSESTAYMGCVRGVGAQALADAFRTEDIVRVPEHAVAQKNIRSSTVLFQDRTT